MRTGIRLPVVYADAMERPRRPGVVEGDDGMIANRAVKHVPEHDHRAAGSSECYAKPAAFACVVMREARLRESAAMIVRPGECERGADIGFVSGFRRNAVTLVQPCREQRSVPIQFNRLEALAFGIGRDRHRRFKTAAAVRGASVQHLFR